MTTWIVTVHSGGGSMGEAMDVMQAFEALNEKQANQIADGLNAAWQLAPRGSWHSELWAQAFGVEKFNSLVLPSLSPSDPHFAKATGGRALGPHEQIIDLRKVAAQIAEGEEAFVLRPKAEPVTDDEEKDALAAIQESMKRGTT